MKLEFNSNRYSTIEFEESEDGCWVGDASIENESFEITVPKKALAYFKEDQLPGWEIVKWAISSIIDNLADLINRSNRILFELQREIFGGDYQEKYHAEKCRFELYSIIFRNVTLLDSDSSLYYVNFELEFSHKCKPSPEGYLLDDIYYDYSCGYNISGSWITLNFAKRLGSCDDFS